MGFLIPGSQVRVLPGVLPLFCTKSFLASPTTVGVRPLGRVFPRGVLSAVGSTIRDKTLWHARFLRVLSGHVAGQIHVSPCGAKHWHHAELFQTRDSATLWKRLVRSALRAALESSREMETAGDNRDVHFVSFCAPGGIFAHRDAETRGKELMAKSRWPGLRNPSAGSCAPLALR